jgi:hypothetical protein
MNEGTVAVYLMFGDEADHEQGRGQQFFVYGATFIDVGVASTLHSEIEEARLEAGLLPADSLKFAEMSRPQRVSREEFRSLKSRVLQIAANHEVVFCAYATLHALLATVVTTIWFPSERIYCWHASISS